MARPERIDAALFDFDGTLCDTEPSNLAFLRRLMEEFGAPVTDEEVRSFAGAHPDEVIPPLLRKYGSPRPTFAPCPAPSSCCATCARAASAWPW